jgi:anthranilate synthase component 1
MQLHPSRSEFTALAAGHGSVPVWCELLGDLVTPVGVYARVAGPGSFLLESAVQGRWGRYSFVGLDPMWTLTGRDGTVTWTGNPPAAALDATGPLDALDKATRALHAPEGLLDLPLHGGAVGYIGFEAVREVEPSVPSTGEDTLGLPDVLQQFPRHVIGLDHQHQRMTVVTNVITIELTDADADAAGQAYDDAVAATLALVDRIAAPIPPAAQQAIAPPLAQPAERAASNMQPEQYEAAVEQVLEHIRAGDTFQTVPSQRFEVPTDADPLTLYRSLRVINPSPYLFLLDLGDHQVIGSSPEALVQVHGRHVETWPIAGTRPRGATPAEDDAHEESLRHDQKEIAEHVMLVDLARNDLGRVSQIGSVKVRDLMTIERYSHVMHLVSSVVGELRDDVSPVDVLRAVFPAGTVSGAPKVRAMQIIDSLEPTRRGVYAGAVGYVDLSGNLDTCIALRTLVLKDGIAYVQAGAGIVADSVPASEEAETRHKAGALLSAIRAASAMTAGAAAAGSNGSA